MCQAQPQGTEPASPLHPPPAPEHPPPPPPEHPPPPPAQGTEPVTPAIPTAHGETIWNVAVAIAQELDLKPENGELDLSVEPCCHFAADIPQANISWAPGKGSRGAGDREGAGPRPACPSRARSARRTCRRTASGLYTREHCYSSLPCSLYRYSHIYENGSG